MPLYYFKCPSCQSQLRKILKPEVAAEPRLCLCGEQLERDPQPPSTQVLEQLDNGIMPKRLERLADAERLYQERAEITEKQRTGKDGT